MHQRRIYKYNDTLVMTDELQCGRINSRMGQLVGKGREFGHAADSWHAVAFELWLIGGTACTVYAEPSRD